MSTERLSTVDESGRRVKLYPAYSPARYARLRIWAQAVLLVFFLAVPWIKVGGQPFLLLNVSDRRIFVLGQMFMPQDLSGFLLLVGLFLFGVMAITALFGRAWCGWACPQTVFVDGVFRRIERWIEGDHVARKRLDKLPFAQKAPKKAAKYAAFTLVSLIITHSFLGIFVGGPEVVQMMGRSPVEHWGSFLFAFISGGFILFNFGWFREQFCLVACPYGRFQAALTDDRTIQVGFDRSRASDCVNCRKCVIVCPTGIDIRNGLQMECVGCTACIDACDPIMEKIGKPSGLIRYGTELEFSSAARPVSQGAVHEGPQAVKQKPRPRVVIYLTAMVACAVGFGAYTATRTPVRVEIARSTALPFQVVKESDTTKVLNHFKANLYKGAHIDGVVSVEVSPEDRKRGLEIVTVPSGAEGEHWTYQQRQFFVKFPKDLLEEGHGRARLNAVWKLKDGARLQEVEVSLVGPES